MIVPIDTTYQHPVRIGNATFLLRTFSAIAWAGLRDPLRDFMEARRRLMEAAKGDDPAATAHASAATQAAAAPLVREGLVGWEGWPVSWSADAHGKPSAASVDSLPGQVLVVLAVELQAHNSVSVAGLGKSSSPSVYDWGSSAETRNPAPSSVPPAEETGASTAETPAS